MLKKSEPSIMLHMKDAKMIPCGRSEAGVDEVRCADLSAADQKKMKRYMEPSKQVEMKPRTRMRLSVIMVNESSRLAEGMKLTVHQD